MTSEQFSYPPNETPRESRLHLTKCLKHPEGVVVIGFKDGTMYVKSPENNFRGIVPSAWLSKPEKDGFLYSSHCCLDVETSPTQWFYRSNWHPGVKDYFGTYKWTPEGGFVKERSIWAEDCQELPGGMGVAFV